MPLAYQPVIDEPIIDEPAPSVQPPYQPVVDYNYHPSATEDTSDEGCVHEPHT